MATVEALEILIPHDGADIRADLACPEQARGLVIFAHGSGSNRKSIRNQFVASRLQQAGFATLLVDLLSRSEAERELLRFDIDLLAGRVFAACDWAHVQPLTRALPLGLFGASTGAAAALQAAASAQSRVKAIVCRGGRPDLVAAETLLHVHAPTLLIVGGRDGEVLQQNRMAAEQLRGEHRVAVVAGAGHLFAEPGALERVAVHALRWFERHLALTSYRPPIAEEACVE